MLKLSLFTCAIVAVGPAIAQADPDPPTPATSPDDEVPTPTESADDAPPPPPPPVDADNPPPPPAETTPTSTAAYVPDTSEDMSMSGQSIWYEQGLSTGIGVGVVIGGGVSGFTDQRMRDVISTDVSGLWDARFTIGTHIPIGLDLSYVGTAASLSSLSGTSSGTLIGTTAEGALRWNMMPHGNFNPYIFAGVGWQRYDVTGRTVTLSDTGIRQSDNSVEFPMGLGLSFRDPSGFIFDVRGTFRANVDQGLVLAPGANPSSPASGNFVPMHTWEASAALGYEF